MSDDLYMDASLNNPNWANDSPASKQYKKCR